MKRNNNLAKAGVLLLGICFSFCACAGSIFSSSSDATDISSIPENANSSSSQSNTAGSDSSSPIDITSIEAMFGNTPNLKCYSIEEFANGDIDDSLQQYDLDKYRTAIDAGHVLEGVGSSWNSMGATFTLQDVWYEDSTANMIDNGYELPSDIKDPIFIFMEINVQNNSNADGILLLNAASVRAFPADYYVQSGEMCYQDHVVDPHPHNSDYAKVSLAIGQSETYTIAFEVGSGFLTYSPIYLDAQAWADDMFSYDDIYIKLPTLEKR